MSSVDVACGTLCFPVSVRLRLTTLRGLVIVPSFWSCCHDLNESSSYHSAFWSLNLVSEIAFGLLIKPFQSQLRLCLFLHMYQYFLYSSSLCVLVDRSSEINQIYYPFNSLMDSLKARYKTSKIHNMYFTCYYYVLHKCSLSA